ncbi:DUF5666 domain-containing protein [Nannocystis pusilla]|uniref:DUF5666 domain-containing protein n=1 Tax=Nannocystis pusilla TaxID=889268 RepID=A0ABS7TPF6_9BACT|nr:DUF5666 domain-containing protein [Nannocystis pusilla]MBZ5710027.1 DUF5666 domain-containing protein [Nannocystis pusilla]
MKSVQTNIHILAAALAIGGSLGFAMVAQEAQARDRDNDDRDEVEVVGPVESLKGTCPDLSFTVKGETIITDEQTEFDDGTCDSIRNGDRVEIEGRIEDGRLVADEVDLE